MPVDFIFTPGAKRSTQLPELLKEDLAQSREALRSRPEYFKEHIDYNPTLENDIRKVIDDKDVDVLINATPDHWHTPGSILALKAGKHVYVEKPSSHNMNENELREIVEKSSFSVFLKFWPRIQFFQFF